MAREKVGDVLPFSAFVIDTLNWNSVPFVYIFGCKDVDRWSPIYDDRARRFTGFVDEGHREWKTATVLEMTQVLGTILRNPAAKSAE